MANLWTIIFLLISIGCSAVAQPLTQSELAWSTTSAMSNTIFGQLWEYQTNAATNAIFANIPLVAPNITFTCSQMNFFYGYTSPGVISNFLFSRQSPTILSGTSELTNSVNNIVILFSGQHFITNNTGFNIGRDDGYTLQIGSWTVSSPGLGTFINGNAESRTYTGSTGNQLFTNFYANGPPTFAVMQITNW